MTNYVLVPGGWLGGWAWKKVVPLLEEEGHRAYPVTLTGMGERVHLASKGLGVDTAVEDVINTIKFEDLKDVALVGHSFAGKVVAAVADRMPGRVNTLVFVDAFRPRNVRTPQGAFSDEFAMEGTSIPFPQEILDFMGKDVLGSDRDWMLSKVTPWPLAYSREPVTLSENYDSVRKAYILCSHGSDPVEEVLKEKLDGPVRVIESGHWPMISRPEELAKSLKALAERPAP